MTMGFPRQEYWSGLLFSSLGHLPDPGIEPTFPTLQGDSLPLSQQGSPSLFYEGINAIHWASLVAQQQRTHMPMQET